MKVLGIAGSPRRGGNSDLLLDAALSGADSSGASSEKIRLNDLSYKPCQECGDCYDTCECGPEDDMRIIYRKVEEADAVIIASPVFFGSVTAQVKAMIDRFQPVWIKREISGHPPLG